MKQIILLIILVLFGHISFGQDSLTINKYNLDKDCNQGGQQEMNVCYGKAMEKLSKIMQTKYECLINYLDNRIKYYYSIKDTSSFFEYKKMKLFISTSQTIWEELQIENASFYKSGGGTITPMLVSESLIMDLKDRLMRLDDFIEEIGQGDDTEVLKCK
jgi:uncharacterized protein YecT (DUF1311 family)